MLGCAAEGLRWLAAGTVSAYLTVYMFGVVNHFNARQINSQEELDALVEKEAKELRLERARGIFRDYPEGAAYLDVDETPVIEVGGFSATDRTVRHELYHHYRGHTIEPNKGWRRKLDYLLRREPQAILYEAAGIKL